MADFLEVDGGTNIGRRAENQDYFWYAPSNSDAGLRNLLIVADGVGGGNFGGDASKIVVDTIKSVVKSEYKLGMPLDEIEELLKRAVKRANLEVHSVAQERSTDSIPLQMGSTVVVAILSGRDIVYSWVGDSRIYYVNSKSRTARQLTKDHTVAEDKRQIQEPGVAIDDALNHMLFNSMGKSEFVVPELARIRFEVSGDALVLCSDGLSNVLSADDIASIVLNKPLAASAVKALIDTALKNNATDNITSIVAIAHLDSSEGMSEPRANNGRRFSYPFLVSVLLLLIIVMGLVNFSSLTPLVTNESAIVTTTDTTNSARSTLDTVATNIVLMTEMQMSITPTPTTTRTATRSISTQSIPQTATPLNDITATAPIAPTDSQATLEAQDTQSAAIVESIISSTQAQETRLVPITVEEIRPNQTYEIAVGTFLRPDPQVDNGFRVPQGVTVVVSLNDGASIYTLETFVHVTISRGNESGWVRLSELERFIP